jgi:hypothetical protein
MLWLHCYVNNNQRPMLSLYQIRQDGIGQITQDYIFCLFFFFFFFTGIEFLLVEREPVWIGGNPCAPNCHLGRTSIVANAKSPGNDLKDISNHKENIRIHIIARTHARTHNTGTHITHTHTHTRTHTCTHACTHTHARTHARTHTHTHTLTCSLSLSHTHTRTLLTHTRTYTLTRLRDEGLGVCDKMTKIMLLVMGG